MGNALYSAEGTLTLFQVNFMGRRGPIVGLVYLWESIGGVVGHPMVYCLFRGTIDALADREVFGYMAI
ncbi:hypothetical protein DSCA_04500 [Desulfosarcina alkanivorans]|uniref:Uncharacterized protein n=1 Tax=Desulfosarcina alkanivorans TaxID=571177 RepID=A0A5K7YET1_9BACT|nr:hypothetical protein [Desulfosarcina alkanivorans]BBO66520.1 hypothetical protein DSCA_04500 [Desulfosarcina alkanivorans]